MSARPPMPTKPEVMNDEADPELEYFLDQYWNAREVGNEAECKRLSKAYFQSRERA